MSWFNTLPRKLLSGSNSTSGTWASQSKMPRRSKHRTNWANASDSWLTVQRYICVWSRTSQPTPQNTRGSYKLRETPSNTTPELSAYQCNVKVPARNKQSETAISAVSECQALYGNSTMPLHHAFQKTFFFAFKASDMPSTHELPSPSPPPELRWDNDCTSAKPSRSCRWQAPVPPRALRSQRNGWQKVTHRNLPEDVMTKCSFMMVCGDLWRFMGLVLRNG